MVLGSFAEYKIHMAKLSLLMPLLVLLYVPAFECELTALDKRVYASMELVNVFQDSVRPQP